MPYNLCIHHAAKERAPASLAPQLGAKLVGGHRIGADATGGASRAVLARSAHGGRAALAGVRVHGALQRRVLCGDAVAM